MERQIGAADSDGKGKQGIEAEALKGSWLVDLYFDVLRFSISRNVIKVGAEFATKKEASHQEARATTREGTTCIGSADKAVMQVCHCGLNLNLNLRPGGIVIPSRWRISV